MKNKAYKQKVITFYDKDKEIYELANKLNFQGFVKDCLRRYLKGEC